MYIVVTDHPCYPEVEYFSAADLDGAKKYVEEQLESLGAEDGKHVLKVSLSKVEELHNSTCHY